jgi:hypothetical protein
LELFRETPNREVSLSTTLSYHAFGIRSYDLIRTDPRDGHVIFTITQNPHHCR